MIRPPVGGPAVEEARDGLGRRARIGTTLVIQHHAGALGSLPRRCCELRARARLRSRAGIQAVTLPSESPFPTRGKGLGMLGMGVGSARSAREPRALPL